MKMIIQSEVKRAEALVERYMGLPPETVDLYSFNANALRNAPADFGKAIDALRRVAGKQNPSQRDAAYAVNVVDLIAQLAQRPKMSAPIQKMWEMEEGIRDAGGAWTLKHLVTVVLATGGVLIGTTKALPLGYELFAYFALVVVIASGALHLTHSNNAATKVPVYTVGALVGFCLLNEVYAPSIGFLALLVCSIVFMAGSFLSLLTGTNKGGTSGNSYLDDYEAVPMETEEYNLYKVTAGNDMTPPIDNLS
jgi:hypothetical protein